MRFGALEFRSGLILTSRFRGFGGLSGLRLDAKGERFIAISDKGGWFTGRIVYKGREMTGLDDVEAAPMLGPDGKPITARGWFDTEALALDGSLVYVAIERVNQILRFDFAKGFTRAPGELVQLPPGARKLPFNKGIEALVMVPKGQPMAGTLIAISERGLDAQGNITAFLIGGKTPGLFSVRRSEDFDVSDAVLLPSGDLLAAGAEIFLARRHRHPDPAHSAGFHRARGRRRRALDFQRRSRQRGRQHGMYRCPRHAGGRYGADAGLGRQFFADPAQSAAAVHAGGVARQANNGTVLAKLQAMKPELSMNKILRVICVLAGFCTATVAQAQGWPTRLIKATIPFGAGSAADVVPRLVFERISAELGQPIVIENRAGGGGTVGSALVAKADPDGYSILAQSSALAISPAIFPSATFDPTRDLASVLMLGSSANVMIVPNARPWKTVQDFIADAKAKPGSISFGSVGIGSAVHITTEKFRFAAGIEATHIPYRSGPEVITDIISGRIDLYFCPLATALPLIRDGQVRALVVSTAKRAPDLPDVPTPLDIGLEGCRQRDLVRRVRAGEDAARHRREIVCGRREGAGRSGDAGGPEKARHRADADEAVRDGRLRQA